MPSPSQSLTSIDFTSPSGGGYGPDPANVPPAFLCTWRKLTYEYANKVRPDAAALVYDALELGKYCTTATANNNNALSTPPKRPDESTLPKSFPRSYGSISSSATDEEEDAVVVVDCVHGSDKNGKGTISSPLKTVQAGVSMARNRRGKTVAVRAGTCYLTQAVQLSAADSGLTISNFNGEAAWLSGGVPLTDITWQKHTTTATTTTATDAAADAEPNIWKADLSAFKLDSMPGLRVNGRRVSMARYPNANPETDFFPIGYLPSSPDDWLQPKIAPNPNPAQVVHVNKPNRDWDVLFPNYGGGIGGTCSIYDPPFSYWCQNSR